tara:strand:+ start:91 stop:417 length:327 start_codon:yes stop_codon:yes gene_type:complete
MPSNNEEKLSRAEKKMLNDLRIITAISLGQDRNKELARFLDTDKSFTSKKVRKLCEEGLVFKEGEGKDVRYTVNRNKVLNFLQSRVVIKWQKKEPIKQNIDSLKNDMS